MTDDNRHRRHVPLLVLLALAVSLLLAREEFALGFLLKKIGVIVTAAGTAAAVALVCIGFGALFLRRDDRPSPAVGCRGAGPGAGIGPGPGPEVPGHDLPQP